MIIPVRIVDHDWALHLRPTPDYIAQSRTSADELMAASGILLLMFLALVLRMLLLRQAELRESQAKYRLLVENQIDMVVQLDPQGNFLYVSPSYCEALGRTESELLGTSCLPLVHPDDREETQAILANLGNPPHLAQHEQRALARDNIVWQSWSNAAVLADDGSLTAITAVGRDITRQRELEDQLNLSRKMQAVGQLAGGIAHDFNNLLQSMLGNLQFVIQDTSPTGQTAEDLKNIEQGIGKAMTLTKQLLAFGRKQELQAKQADLNSIVDGVLEQLRRNLGAAVKLVFNPADRPVLVRVDQGQTEQIIHNLCDNAHDALGSDGTIIISTEVWHIDTTFCQKHPELEPGTYAGLVVSDNGHGMPPEVLERAFEPFYTTQEVGGGTGLGLATSFGIVQQHRGTIFAESIVDQGSVFTVLLPLEDAEEPPTGHNNSPPTATAHETILLAEDNASVRDLAIRVLKHAGYQVLFASGYDPASMISDQKLPEGAETLMKPYGISDLLQKVRAILDHPKSAE